MKEFVRTIKDYPIKGIQFRDITTLLQRADLFHDLIDDFSVDALAKRQKEVASQVGLPDGLLLNGRS